MKSSPKSILITLISAALIGCGGETQQPNSVLYEAKILTDTTTTVEKPFTKDASVGPENDSVPIKVSWNSTLDQDGCWKIRDLKVERIGGNAKVVIDGIRHSAQGCALDMNSTDDKRFQPVVIFFNYKSQGLKTHQGTDVSVLIRGDGKPIVDKL